jgi:tight adherence protein C
MPPIALIVALVALAIVVVAFILVLRRPSSGTRRTLDQIDKYGFSGRPVEERTDSGRPRTVGGLVDALGDAIAARHGPQREEAIRAKLISSGLYGTTPRTYFAAQAIGALACLGVWAVLGGLSGVSSTLYFVGMPVALFFGWSVPTIVLSRRLKARYHEIEKSLPDLIDLLVVTVEAGIGFVGSLRMASEQLEGPLAQELRLTLQEQSMGRSSTEALEGLAQRADTPGVRSFVRAIVQGELLGVSIGRILRNLAAEMRKKRKAKAEEQAQKAPVKMLFPLVLLIFPAMFVVLLLPALISIKDTLGG